MTEFKKGYWNLQELEIQEWIKPKQKGFMKNDIEELKRHIKKDVLVLSGEGTNYITNQVIQILNKRFGWKGSKDNGSS